MKPLPDDLIVVSCAGCKATLATNRDDAEKYALSALRGRIKGRPFCGPCLTISQSGVSGVAGGSAVRPAQDALEGSPGPWYDNALRHAEDA